MLFRRQGEEQRALYLRQQRPHAHNALRDSASETGMVSLAGGRREGSAYQDWSAEDRDGVTAYEDFASRPRDPRVRNGINDPHSYSVAAIQHGAVPEAEQTPRERRLHASGGLRAPGLTLTLTLALL